MLYRYTGRVFKQMTTPLQAFASPPESARREAVSVMMLVVVVVLMDTIQINLTQECAFPPESARREEVSVKAAAPLASVPAASSYPGRILTRFLLGL